MEANNISQFLRSVNPDDIIITLKSKQQSVSIKDYRVKKVIQLLCELYKDPFTGELYNLPAKKRGRQEGLRRDYYLQQKLARDLYLNYKREHGSARGAYNFIKEIFDAAGHSRTTVYIKKLIDLKNWPENHKVIWREIKQGTTNT